MIEVPKYVGREFRPFDWYGWIMALIGCIVMYFLIRDTTFDWTRKIIYSGLTVLIFLDYVWRVAYGRVYKMVYYDTLLHTMYKVSVGDDIYYICSDTEEELDLYMEVNYPSLDYKIEEELSVESYIKKEHFQ